SSKHRCIRSKSRVRQYWAKILQLHSGNPEIRLVRTPPAHSFRVTVSGKRKCEVDSDQFEHTNKQPLSERVDLIERSEAHLHIELSEFRLTVSTQIFVAKTTRDLKVLIETRDHAQLLEELRRLGKGEKLPRLYARRHDVIAGAFGRGLDQNRRFNL